MYAVEPVKKNCWNHYWSYGQICCHCGCCSDDPKKRYESRISVLNDEIDRVLRFLEAEKYRANVRPYYYWYRNAKYDLRIYRSEIKHYRMLLKKGDLC